MWIGFVAPMKAPDHPVPSGDRQMARLLGQAFALAGHNVDLLSTHRTFLATPDPQRAAALAQAAAAEVERVCAAWRDPAARPAAVLAYHLHYKAPDLVGLPLARRFGLPYLTAEASYARKRDAGFWGERQALVVEAVRAAAVNLCFTANDRAGLSGLADPDSLVDLPPFIDTARFFYAQAPVAAPVDDDPSAAIARRAAPRQASLAAGDGLPRFARNELITVAMMRPGDKLASYRFLAEALRLSAGEWRLTVVGDGPERAAVEALFAGFLPGRVHFTGVLAEAAIGEALRRADLLVWPGFNEAFGLCYLEAQACGLPVLAVTGEGTPSVVRHGETGWLTPPDAAAYAGAMGRLLDEPTLRQRLGAAATRFVHDERSLPQAARRLDAALDLACRRHREAGHG